MVVTVHDKFPRIGFTRKIDVNTGSTSLYPRLIFWFYRRNFPRWFVNNRWMWTSTLILIVSFLNFTGVVTLMAATPCHQDEINIVVLSVEFDNQQIALGISSHTDFPEHPGLTAKLYHIYSCGRLWLNSNWIPEDNSPWTNIHMPFFPSLGTP